MDVVLPNESDEKYLEICNVRRLSHSPAGQLPQGNGEIPFFQDMQMPILTIKFHILELTYQLIFFKRGGEGGINE